MNIINKHQAIIQLKSFLGDKPIIVEAGAYKGNDSLFIAEQFPDAIFHLFEPVPELFTQLKVCTSSIKHTHYWPYALSNKTGTATFHTAEKKEKPGIATQAGSLLEPKNRLLYSPIIYPHTTAVKTITLDQWAHKNNITTIDFIWLDVQGHELAVLQHATKLLSTVKALWVELHFIDAYHNQPKDTAIIKWLSEYGFTMVAQDFKNKTDWFFGNGLFIRNDLINQLAKSDNLLQ